MMSPIAGTTAKTVLLTALVFALSLAAVVSPARGASRHIEDTVAASLPSGADAGDSFAADPRSSSTWEFPSPGSWTWSATGLFAGGTTDIAGDALWKANSFAAGRIGVRLKFLPGKKGTARGGLIFARQPDGAYRYVLVTPGAPGKIVLGQVGTIGGVAAGVKRSKLLTVPWLKWRALDVTIDSSGNTVVRYGGTAVFTLKGAAPTGLKPVNGNAGFRQATGRCLFDDFYIDYLSNNNLPCQDCHAGQTAAPNVFTYWDGSWWAERHGSTTGQRGGHGDARNRPALGCTGTNGCHAMGDPHPDGVLNGRDHPTANSYQLRAGFFPATVANSWDVQVTFDDYCYTACHASAGAKTMTHPLDEIPAPGAVRFGDHGTVADGSALPFPIDRDLTTRAAGPGTYAPCVSCHDVHGTGAGHAEGSNPNHMVRQAWRNTSEQCLHCHR